MEELGKNAIRLATLPVTDDLLPRGSPAKSSRRPRKACHSHEHDHGSDHSHRAKHSHEHGHKHSGKRQPKVNAYEKGVQ